jgi:hypothetical protein
MSVLPAAVGGIRAGQRRANPPGEALSVAAARLFCVRLIVGSSDKGFKHLFDACLDLLEQVC